ncbi:MAG: acetylxylan esterase [Bryobacterales bacterium]|nr:acetylxylan esterase [Bryobacterales bacterium]
MAEVPKTDLRNGTRPNTDTAFQPRDYTRAEWEARRVELKQRVLFAAGLEPMPARTPLNAQVFGRIEGDGYTIEKVLLETMPGFFLGGNLYRPGNAQGKVPAILHPHGHWTYGRLENQPLYSAPTFGINMARQGFVVFAYDMVGYNDTPQVPHRFTGKREQLWQFTPLGLQLWNSIRVIDFLEALPDVDPKRIGASGASGGGTQVFLLGAVDDRVAAAAPVNMVSLIMQGGCVCENAPHLRVDTQNVEMSGLMAPRPQLIVAATGDWTRNVPTVEFPAVQKIYALYDAAGKVEHVQFEAPHNFHKPSREAVYTFFNKVFLGKDGSPVAERNAPVPDARDLLVLWNHPMPGHARSFQELFADWRAMSDSHAAQPDIDRLRQRLAMAIEASLPARVETATEGSQVVLSAGKGDRVPLQVRKGSASSKEAVILVHPDGGAAALASQEMLTRAGKDATVYAPEIYQTGAAKAAVTERHLHHTTFNWSDDAQRVQDLLTTVAYAKAQGAMRIRILGSQQGNAWAILAAAMSKGSAIVEAPPFSAHPEWGHDEWLAEHCFIPGLQRAGGIPAALRVLGAARQ